MASLELEAEPGHESRPQQPTGDRRPIMMVALLGVFVIIAGIIAFVVLGGDDDADQVGSSVVEADAGEDPAAQSDAEVGAGGDDPTGTGEQPATDAQVASPDLPLVFRHFGNPQIALSLADTEVGGAAIDAATLRVRFPRGGMLSAVRPFVVYKPGNVGNDGYYHKGDGSTIEFRLEADDGTPDHNPSGEILAWTGNLIGGPEIYEGSGPEDARLGGDETDDGHFRKFSFINPVEVEANTWYHLVMYNTGNDPRDNFVSYDNMNSGDRDRDAVVPVFDDLDFGVKYRSGGTWSNRDEHWAIGDFYFSDGWAYGNGYMEVGSVNGPDRVSNFVSPDQSVRQRFTPSEDLIVSGAHVGAMHVDGDNRVKLTLTDGDGTVRWSGEAADFPTGTPSGTPGGRPTVVTAEFRGDDSIPQVVLKADQEYFLLIESMGGTHTVTGVRDGSLSYNFSEDTTVLGQAELRSGTEDWLGWQLGENSDVRNQFDLSFYLLTENCVGCS